MNFRRTKIIATLDPATQEEDILVRLIKGGVDVMRLGMAHASHDWVREVVRLNRAPIHKLGVRIQDRGG